MAFKFVVLAAFVAIASAGGPAAYDIATATGDHNSVGLNQESTQKGYGGQNVISSYSRAEDSAHSSVRVSNSHFSNDLLKGNLHYAAAPIVKSSYAPSYGASAYAYAAPAPAYGYASHVSTGPVLPAKAAYAAPAYGYTAPLIAKTYAAPVAPILTKSYGYPAQAPLLAKTAYLASAHEYAAHGYATSALSPIIAKTAYAAPILAKAYAAPVVTKTAGYAGPYGYEATAPIVHTTFTGLGTNYAW